MSAQQRQGRCFNSVSLMRRCSAGRPSPLFAQSRGCPALAPRPSYPAVRSNSPHRKLTSLAHVNISLGLFLEVQEGKIVFLRLQSQAENNEDGIRETVEEPLMNIYYLHSTHG